MPDDSVLLDLFNNCLLFPDGLQYRTIVARILLSVPKVITHAALQTFLVYRHPLSECFVRPDNTKIGLMIRNYLIDIVQNELKSLFRFNNPSPGFLLLSYVDSNRLVFNQLPGSVMDRLVVPVNPVHSSIGSQYGIFPLERMLDFRPFVKRLLEFIA